MALPGAILPREYEKFFETPGGDVAVRVGLGDDRLGVTDFYTDVALGNVPGFSFFPQFGTNDNVSIANREDIWPPGGTWVPVSTAAVIDIASDDSSDTLAGSGARTVRILGLDANYDEQTEDVDLNGTTPVSTTNTFLRINRINVIDVGASDENVGEITAEISSITQAVIKRGFNRTTQAIYTIPNNRNGYIVQAQASVVANSKSFAVKEGAVFLFVKQENQPFQVSVDIGINSRAGIFDITRQLPIKLPEKTDVKARFESFTQNSKVHAAFDILLEDTT